ncbi:hypothetical protein ABZ769_28845 [Streptomyces olivoreticuli]
MRRFSAVPGEAGAGPSHDPDDVARRLRFQQQRQARALTVLGQAFCDLGQHDRGHAYLRDALAMFHRLGTGEPAQVQMLLAEERVL